MKKKCGSSLSLGLLPRPCVLISSRQNIIAIFQNSVKDLESISLPSLPHVTILLRPWAHVKDSTASGIIRELSSILMLKTRMRMRDSHILLNRTFSFISNWQNYITLTKQNETTKTKDYIGMFNSLFVLLSLNFFLVVVKICPTHIIVHYFFSSSAYIRYLRL